MASHKFRVQLTLEDEILHDNAYSNVSVVCGMVVKI